MLGKIFGNRSIKMLGMLPLSMAFKAVLNALSEIPLNISLVIERSWLLANAQIWRQIASVFSFFNVPPWS